MREWLKIWTTTGILLAFLLSSSLLMGQNTPTPPKDEAPKDPAKDPSKEPDKDPGKDPKKEEKKEEKLEVPPLPYVIDTKKSKEDFILLLQHFSDYIKNRLPLLLKNLDNFKGFDQNLRRAVPFISSDFLRGIRTESPSQEECMQVRKFWVRAQSFALLEDLAKLSSVQKALERGEKSVSEGIQTPSEYALPFLPEYFYTMKEIRNKLDTLRASTPPAILTSILENIIKQIDEEQEKLKQWEKQILESQAKCLEVEQVKDENFLKGFVKATSKSPLLVKLELPKGTVGYKDGAGKIYFLEQEKWQESISIEDFLDTWRLLKLAVSLPPEGITSKVLESMSPKAKAGLAKKEKIYGLLSPLFSHSFSTTEIILNQKKKGLANQLEEWKKRDYNQNIEPLFAQALLTEALQATLEEVLDLFQKNNVLSLDIKVSSKENLLIKIEDQALDLNQPVMVVPSDKAFVILKGTRGKELLRDAIVWMDQKYKTISYYPQSQIVAENLSVNLNENFWKALDEKLKTPQKKPAFPTYETDPRKKFVRYSFLDGDLGKAPFDPMALPAYQYLIGSKFLVPLSLPADSDKLQKDFEKFHKQYENFSKPHQTPKNLVQSAIGHKAPFDEVKSIYDSYWTSLKEKKKKEAIALYSQISGDKDGENIVNEWLKYDDLIEKYKTQSAQEENEPFTPLFSQSDGDYLQKENLPSDGNVSKAQDISKYDGNPTAEQLSMQEEVPNPQEGMSEGEKYVESLIKGMEEKNLSQKKELKEFLKRDLGPKNNQGNLENIRVAKRVVTLKIASESAEGVLIDLKINGQMAILNGKNMAKFLLKKEGCTLTLNLEVGYNTVEILAQSVASNGLNSGTIEVSPILGESKSQQRFYLSEYEVGTFTIYLPLSQVDIK